jgi:flagellar hook-associated protein 1 FlgK
LSVAQINIADTDAPIQSSSGKLAGLITSRDQILGGFLDKLDSFAGTLASEFNKVYASGQGLNGFTTVTAQNAVDAADKPLDATGLKFPPVNGSFQIQVHNTKTNLTTSTNIDIALNGLDTDTTLNSLAAQLNAVSGVSATISPGGKLTIKSTSDDQDIAFAKDTSGVLTGLGINTFFTGSDALGLAVNADVVKDPGKFAASQNGIGQDTLNAVALTQFIDKPLDSRDGDTIANVFDGITAETTQGSTVAQSVAQGFQVYADGLQQQSMATSGVNLDEEAVKMITLQRTYQASAKYISAINDLLQVLVNL